MKQKLLWAIIDPYALGAIICFAILGALTGRHINSAAGFMLAYAVFSALIAWVCLTGLAGLLYASNGQVRQQHGWPGVTQAVAKGMLLIFPFTALALIAEVALGWNATLAFTSAGIMTAGAAVGAEMMKLGGGRLVNMILPTLGASGLSSVWIMLSAFVQGMGR